MASMREPNSARKHANVSEYCGFWIALCVSKQYTHLCSLIIYLPVSVLKVPQQYLCRSTWHVKHVLGRVYAIVPSIYAVIL